MISKNRGATYAEMIFAVLLAGMVLLGLLIVYMLGVDAWERTASKMVLQETGSLALYRLTKDIQRADSLFITEGGTGLYCEIAPFDSTEKRELVTYSVVEDQLFREVLGEKELIVPVKEIDSLSFLALEGEMIFQKNRDIPLGEFDNVVDILFSITLDKGKSEERMVFQTTVGQRN